VNVPFNISSYRLEILAILEVVRIEGNVLRDVMGTASGHERILQARGVASVEVDDLLVQAVISQKVQR
jgi:hypothetical protein